MVTYSDDTPYHTPKHRLTRSQHPLSHTKTSHNFHTVNPPYHLTHAKHYL